MTTEHKLTKLRAGGVAPNMRTQFYREHWDVARTRLPEPKHTYETILHGQRVTVRVLPSASEATPEEWKTFTAMPVLVWLPKAEPKSRGRRMGGPGGGHLGATHFISMDETAFEHTLLKGSLEED